MSTLDQLLAPPPPPPKKKVTVEGIKYKIHLKHPDYTEWQQGQTADTPVSRNISVTPFAINPTSLACSIYIILWAIMCSAT